jgi:hypothetical protein
MLNQFAKSCSVIAGIAITTMATTGYAAMFGATSQSSDILQMARTQSALNATSFRSYPDGPFVPGGVFAANATAYGKTYGEWGAEWWKWALSIPADMNPIVDTTGDYCTMGQSGHVWFLGGTFVSTSESGPLVRDCTIPAGKAIFYPVINGTWIEEPGDEIYTDEEVRWVVANFTAGGNLGCQITSTLDSFSTPNLGEVPAPVTAQLRPVVRAQSQKFTVNLPENNVLGYPPGKNERLIAEGYWVMLPPLTPGEHVLTLHGAECLPIFDDGEEIGIEKGFETEVEYHLTVLPGGGR